MKFILRWFHLVLCILLLASVAQARNGIYSFDISKGWLSITPAYCPSGRCETLAAELSGTFTAILAGDQILFGDIDVVSFPEVGFRLPEDPNSDSAGTINTVKFSFIKGKLRLTGTIDLHAIDGPFYRYRFTAESMDSIGFNPRGLG